MSLVLAGIDEAGYGPMLGPLCVGFSAFRIVVWESGEGAPDLWDLLSAGVCRKPGDRRRRVAVEDSKKLKLANSSQRHHPVAHLERGVLAFLGAMGDEGVRVTTDTELFDRLFVTPEGHDWYACEPRPIPVGQSAEETGITANTIRLAAHGAGVEVLAMRCRAVGEAQFNDIVDRAGTKAAATELAIGSYLRSAWDRWAAEPNRADGGPRIVCDRQGGRTDYGPVLTRLVPDATVSVLEESDRACRYRLTGDGREMTVLFLAEAESRHLPVALASMVAKYVRELMMARFNAYWCGLCPDLKPTAGYTLDARRWLRDAQAAGVVADQQRRVMVRRS
ncbi:MAG: hypothetical protein KF745_10580 [Phycisphaeraceae bacterium]|nr:hypothetical protein [Phycisphaeraceae bacterium]